MKIQWAAGLAACVAMTPLAHASARLEIRGTFETLSTTACTQDCTQTESDIAPSAFDFTAVVPSDFGSYQTASGAYGDGRTWYRGGMSSTTQSTSTDYAHPFLMPTMGLPNLTLEQFAQGTGSSYSQSAGLGADKSLVLAPDGSFLRSHSAVGIDLSQSWSTTTAQGDTIQASYEFSTDLWVDWGVPKTPAEVQTPFAASDIDARMRQLAGSGNPIWFDMTYTLYDSSQSGWTSYDYGGEGSVVAVSLDAPAVPEPAPGALLLAGAALVGAVARRRAGSRRAG